MVLIHSHGCATITTIHPQNSFYLAKLNLRPHETLTPHPPSPKPLIICFYISFDDTWLQVLVSIIELPLGWSTGTGWLAWSEPRNTPLSSQPHEPWISTFVCFYHFSSFQPRFMFFYKWVLELCHFVFLFITSWVWHLVQFLSDCKFLPVLMICW